MKKIFVSIASYRDPELEYTVESAVTNSSGEYQINFGIVCQGVKNEIPDLSKYKNISMITMHPRDARGVGFARAKAMDLYKDEDYYLQVDSHSQFIENWDKKLVEIYNKTLSIKNKKVILSAFPGMYLIENSKRTKVGMHESNIMTHPSRQRLVIRKTNEWASERIPFENKLSDLPEISNTVLAGFIFSSGNIVKEIPYDPEISFFGEEVCFAARAWTSGYDIYSPKEFIIYHFYGRNGYKKVWKDDNVRPVSWDELQKISKQKQKDVLCGFEKSIYGLGKVRSLKKYEEFVGYDFKKHYGLTNAWD